MSFPDQSSGAIWPAPILGKGPGSALGNVLAPSGADGVRGAIARAASATGVDFSYLLAQAKLESSLNPAARAATSSAAGLYQFTSGTWLDTLRKHGDQVGMPGTAAALADPAARAQVMALRFNPEISARMAAELAGDNRETLSNALGREPDASELYLAHFLGAEGAVRFLGGLAANPGQAAMTVLPKAAAANRAIFFDSSGNPRSLQGVMDLLRGKLAGAMRDGAMQADSGQDGSDLALSDMEGLPVPGFSGLDLGSKPSAPPSGGPLARQFAAARDQGFAALAGGAGQTAVSAPSMADTLAQGFGLGAETTGSTMPEAVRVAYARIRAAGL